MVTIQEQIVQQRAIIQSAKAIPSKSELRNPETNTRMAMIERKANQEKVSRAEIQFEKSVGLAAPELARPEYIQQAYSKVKEELQPIMQDLQNRISSRTRQIEEIKQKGNLDKTDRRDMQNIINKMRAEQAELDAYTGSLNGNPIDVIKKYNSGEIQSTAMSEAAKIQNKTATIAANKRAQDEVVRAIQKEYPGMKYTPQEALKLAGLKTLRASQAPIFKAIQESGLTGGQALDVARATGLLETPMGAKTEGTVIKSADKIIYIPNNIMTSSKTIKSEDSQAILEKSLSKEENYNSQIKQAYESKLNGIPIKYGFGDNKKGFSFEDIYETGSYNKYSGIFVNNLWGLDKNNTLSHEVGHAIDGQLNLNKNNIYQNSSKDWTSIFGAGSFLGYNKEEIPNEQVARSFANYIKNPEKFKSKFPEQAATFEKALGYQAPALAVETGSSNITSPVQSIVKPALAENNLYKVPEYIGRQDITTTPEQLYQAGRIPIGEKIYSLLVTPQKFYIKPGASTSFVTYTTPEELQTAQSKATTIGEKLTTAEYKPTFISYAAAGLVPRTTTQLLGMAVLGGASAGAAAVAPLATSIGFTGYGGYSGYKYVTGKDLTTEEKTSYAAGTLGLLGGMKLIEYSPFGVKPYQVKPTPEMEVSVQPFTRQRATLLLTTEKGKYVLGETKSGEIISIGGGIEKGQTPRGAALIELKQETGLGPKDISGLKKVGTVVTPEETFFTYKATLSKEAQAKMKPASDVRRFVTVSPKNPFIKGVTGQTGLQPISRQVPFIGRIRAYEAGLINYAETGVKPTWLAIKTPQGEFYLGTQSRYNVPGKIQKQYLQQEELLLAHGTPAPAVLKGTSLPGQKAFTIEAAQTQRGQAQGLYLQPPIGLNKGFRPDFVVYHGTPRVAEVLKTGIKPAGEGNIKAVNTLTFGMKNEGYIYFGKTPEVSKPYTITGGEILPIYKEPLKVGLTKAQALKLEGKGQGYDYPGAVRYKGSIPAEQVKPIGESFTTPAPGYIGLSYLGFQSSQESLGAKIAFPIRTAYLFREKPTGAIGPTPKTLSGMESELIITPDTTISTTQKATIASIGGKRVYLQPTKIVKPGEGTQTIMSISEDYGAYRYVTPGEVVAQISSISKSKPNKQIVIISSVPKKEETISKISSSKSISTSISIIPSKVIEPSNIPKITEPSKIPSVKVPYKIPSSFVPRMPSKIKVPKPIPSPVPPYNPRKEPPTIIEEFGRRTKIKELAKKISKQGYELQIKRFGKYKTIAQSLSLSRAKQLGARKVMGSLGQTFRIIPKGQTQMGEVRFELPSKVFTKLKRPTTQLEWVERRGMTLKRGTGEIPAILAAKKSKPKKFRIW